jgi:hypothetical protein
MPPLLVTKIAILTTNHNQHIVTTLRTGTATGSFLLLIVDKVEKSVDDLLRFIMIHHHLS